MWTRPTVVAACVILAGCGNASSPTEPARLPSAATPAHLAIDGPASVPPGATAQFRLTATTVTGVTQDVSRDATWKSIDPGLLQSLGAGAFKAGAARGETNLVATSSAGTAAAIHVLVLEDGTFVVRGTVSDGGFGLPGAQVQISNGIGAGQSTTTDPSGRYALYGAAGSVTLDVTFTDYQSQTQTVDVSGDTTTDFSLSVIGNRPDISGPWRLTFTASPACTDLPDDARVRTYPMSIQLTGPAVHATLKLTASGWPLTDTVLIDGQFFSQSLTLIFPTDSFDGPEVYEHLAGGQSFTLEGHASATYVAGRFDGLLDGTVRVFNTATFQGTACVQADHRWRLERITPS
jgi:hypothetical protein